VRVTTANADSRRNAGEGGIGQGQDCASSMEQKRSGEQQRMTLSHELLVPMSHMILLTLGPIVFVSQGR